MRAKKSLLLIPAIFLLSPTLFSCNQNDPNVVYLKVLNSEDYIQPELITKFENETTVDGKKVKIIYDTFDTMENMFNTLKTGKTKYDLVCASEYMVQKLVNLNLVEKINLDKVENYKNYCSQFVRDRLTSVNLDEYCVCYMWGTLGLLYNPTFAGYNSADVFNDMTSWNGIWNHKYERTISIKDSMRDTYAIGLIHRYQDELNKESELTKRQEIFERGGAGDPLAKEHVNEIKADLLSLRSNVFGFEVDSGKEDIVTEKIGINTAWSGDAVRSINQAEEDKNLKLYYSIPKEGSNLWFDCWAMQNNGNQELAYQFLNFLCSPENAIENMKEIGYTSAIAKNDVIFNYYNEKYGKADGETYDVKYFFGDEHPTMKVNGEYIGRQLTAQFPSDEEVSSLMVMKDYGDNNDLILKMWEQVKHDPLPAWAIALFVIEIAAVAAGLSFLIIRNVKDKNRRRRRRLKTATK